MPSRRQHLHGATRPSGNNIRRRTLCSALSNQRTTPCRALAARGCNLPQFAQRLSNRDAAEALRTRIDWKYLLGLELSDSGFDYSILSRFCDRLIEGHAEMSLLDRFLDLCKSPARARRCRGLSESQAGRLGRNGPRGPELRQIEDHAHGRARLFSVCKNDGRSGHTRGESTFGIPHLRLGVVAGARAGGEAQFIDPHGDGAVFVRALAGWRVDFERIEACRIGCGKRDLGGHIVAGVKDAATRLQREHLQGQVAALHVPGGGYALGELLIEVRQVTDGIFSVERMAALVRCKACGTQTPILDWRRIPTLLFLG
jgi:hypothetical protein